MKHAARLATDSRDASSVSRALNVDNIKLDGLKIESGIAGGQIITNIETNNLKTLINTLDDLIS
jgi:nitrate reductase NapAB chaperone NapD